MKTSLVARFLLIGFFLSKGLLAIPQIRLRSPEPQDMLALAQAATEGPCQLALQTGAPLRLHTEIGSYLRALKFPEQRILLTATRVEKVITGSGLFSEAGLVPALIVGMIAQEHQTREALLRFFGSRYSFNLDNIVTLRNRVIDAVAVLLYASEIAYNKQLAEGLGMKLSDLQSHLPIWKKLRREDPALFHFEIALRFMIDNRHEELVDKMFRGFFQKKQLVEKRVEFKFLWNEERSLSLLEKVSAGFRKSGDYVVALRADTAQGTNIVAHSFKDIVVDEPIVQFLMTRYRDRFTLEEMEQSLRRGGGSQWEAALKEDLLRELEALKKAQAPIEEAHSKFMQASKDYDEMQERVQDITVELTRNKDLLEHLISWKKFPEFLTTIPVGYVDESRVAREAKILAELKAHEEKLSALRARLLPRAPGIPEHTATLAPHILAQAGPFYSLVYETLMEEDSRAATNRSEERNYRYYFPEDTVYHRLQDHLRHHGNEIQPDDFLAGLSLLLNTSVLYNCECKRISQCLSLPIFARGIVQEMPLSREEFRRVQNLLEYHLKVRFAINPLEITERQWRKPRREGFQATAGAPKTFADFLEERKSRLQAEVDAFAAQGPEIEARLSAFRAEALSEAEAILEERITRGEEELKTVWSESLQLSEQHKAARDRYERILAEQNQLTGK
jgi:hypothetical protein